MVADRVFWYRRILAMAVIALSMAFLCTKLIDERQDDVVLTGNSGTLIYPCGFPVGIYLETEGVLVIGTDTITGVDGLNYEPAYDLIREGDYIVALNGETVSAKAQLSFLIKKYGNKDIDLTIRRDGALKDVTIKPVKVGNGSYKLGIWVKDDSQGIGTMTFLCNDGSFGALGHGISDVDTKKLLSSNEGLLYGAKIWGITKARAGTAGSLCGSINYEEDKIIGEINKNSSIGIYGVIPSENTVDGIVEEYNLKPYEICSKYDVKIGKATILACVTGSVKEYDIEITELKVNSEGNKGIVLKVTDEELLNETGGIVQGMSGSPILQNGKLVGAVTHVFLRDSSLGYGIFIENMLKQ